MVVGPITVGKSNRFDYVKYDEVSQARQDAFKKAFADLAGVLETMKSSRATSLALTKLEETYMWVGKAIRDDQIARNGSAELQEERGDTGQGTLPLDQPPRGR